MNKRPGMSIAKAAKKLKFNKSIEEKLTEDTLIGETLSATIAHNIFRDSKLSLHETYKFFENNVSETFQRTLPRDMIRRSLAPLSRHDTVRMFNTIDQPKKKIFLEKIDRLTRNFIIEQTGLRDLPVHDLIDTISHILNTDKCDVLDLTNIDKIQLQVLIQEGALHNPRAAITYLRKTHPKLLSDEIAKIECSRSRYENRRSEMFQNIQIYMTEHLNVSIHLGWRGKFSNNGCITGILSGKRISVMIDNTNIRFQFKQIGDHYAMVSNRHVIEIHHNLAEKYALLSTYIPRELATTVISYM